MADSGEDPELKQRVSAHQAEVWFASQRTCRETKPQSTKRKIRAEGLGGRGPRHDADLVRKAPATGTPSWRSYRLPPVAASVTLIAAFPPTVLDPEAKRTKSYSGLSIFR